MASQEIKRRSLPPMRPDPERAAVLIVTIQPGLGRYPTSFKCPNCKHEGLSQIKKKITIRTHLCVAILFFLLCIPCCFIPYCATTCKDVNHHCAKCGQYLGTSME